MSPRFGHVSSTFSSSGIFRALCRSAVANVWKDWLIWESLGAVPLRLLHWLPSRSCDYLFHLETWIKNVFIVLVLVVRARPSCKRPQVGWNCFFRGFFTKADLRTPVTVVCLFSQVGCVCACVSACVRVCVCFVKKFFTYSWCYLSFSWVRKLALSVSAVCWQISRRGRAIFMSPVMDAAGLLQESLAVLLSEKIRWETLLTGEYLSTL